MHVNYNETAFHISKVAVITPKWLQASLSHSSLYIAS